MSDDSVENSKLSNVTLDDPSKCSDCGERGLHVCLPRFAPRLMQHLRSDPEFRAMVLELMREALSR